jgi:hypothetical protein
MRGGIKRNLNLCHVVWNRGVTQEKTGTNIMMGEKDRRLPKLLIDKFECKELPSQLEVTPVIKSSKGEIQKVKIGDKLSP